MSSLAGATIADLLAHPDRKHLELVDGRLIERGLGTYGAWVVNFQKRCVLVRRSDRPDVVLHESDMIDAADIIPHFSVRVSGLFPSEGDS